MTTLTEVSGTLRRRVMRTLVCVAALISLLPGAALAQSSYDVVVYGGGLGGVSAAIEAKRKAPAGTRVAIFEPTDFLGGQLVAAGVSTIDGDGQPDCAPSFDNCMVTAGIWGEFLQRLYARYVGWPSRLGRPAAEPHVGQDILTQMVTEASIDDVWYGKQVIAASVLNGAVTTISFADGTSVSATYFIDASEYGDLVGVLGQAGSDVYRVGNSQGGQGANGLIISPNFSARVQAITWTAMLKKYPFSIPADIDPLVIGPPPGYSAGDFSSLVIANEPQDRTGLGFYPRGFNWLLGYRYTPNTTGVLAPYSDTVDYTGNPPQTKFSVNFTGVNDWLYSANQLLSLSSRQSVECDARLRTLQFMYFVRSSLGLSWSITTDEGYDTTRNRQAVDACGEAKIPNVWKAIAHHLPPSAYVRESVRGVGPYTVTGLDVFRFNQPPPGIPGPALNYFPTSVATGSFFDDFHDVFFLQSPNVQVSDLEPIDQGFAYNNIPIYDPDYSSGHANTNAGGPFQIPFEAMFSAKLSNLIFGGKTISQTRVGNAPSRVHPSEMRIGQAAGMIAALCLKNTVAPAVLNPYYVQSELVTAGQPISGLNFTDVKRNHAHWWSVQIVSASRILVGHGNNDVFLPDNVATRGEAASGLAHRFAFPLKYRGDRNNLPTPPTTPRFTDVATTDMIYSAVDWIATPHPPMAALTSGCGNGTTFCPGDPLLRGQLAVFLARGMILPSATVALNDVSPSDPLYPYIAAVVQNNVMLAPGGTFGPNQPVTRGELADALANSILYAMPKTGNLLQLTNCVPYPSFPCP